MIKNGAKILACLNKNNNTCPAIILQLKRKLKVKGRINCPTSSIKISLSHKNLGELRGSKIENILIKALTHRFIHRVKRIIKAIKKLTQKNLVKLQKKGNPILFKKTKITNILENCFSKIINFILN